jgi:predicted Zn-dependent protease
MEAPATEATVIPLGTDNALSSPSAVAPATARPPAESPPARPANPAVVALLNRANQQSGSGQHAGAASSLERAIKIDPGNPWLWHRLAATRLDQGRPGEAASLAAKSNSLAAGDPELQADNWRLIARVHRQRGEEVAARAAEARARRLSVPRT